MSHSPRIVAAASPRQGWRLSPARCWHWLRFDGLSLCGRVFDYHGERAVRVQPGPTTSICETCEKRLRAMKGQT